MLQPEALNFFIVQFAQGLYLGDNRVVVVVVVGYLHISTAFKYK